MVDARERSPRIASVEWGTTEVEGVGRFKDVKLWPGGAREWDWRETGTRHVPGIQPADLEELVAAGAEVVVLSRGMLRRLRTGDGVVEWLRARGVETHIEETKRAVALYNELAGERPVGALIHSTC